jgi:NAD(P)-dependent dehydrogenase (short-subunit alcohol dehydrogenase family)
LLRLFHVVASEPVIAMIYDIFSAHGLLRRSRGCVVNMASMLSFFGGSRVLAYTASKGGVVQLTKALAVAWAPEGIR